MLSDIEVSKRIKNARNDLGLTLQELADLSGISKSSLQRYEKGNVDKMPLSKITDLAKSLKVTPTYLIGMESKDLGYEYFKNLLGLLDEFGYKIEYEGEKDKYKLTGESSSTDLSAADIKDLKDSVSSFLRFRLDEIKKKNSTHNQLNL